MKVSRFQTLSNEVEALMLAQLLESEGIQTVIKPMGGGYGVLGATQWMHHAVFIPEDDFERAAKIMESIEIAPDFEGEEVCGS